MRNDHGGTLMEFGNPLQTQEYGLFHCSNSMLQLQVKGKAAFLRRMCIPTMASISIRCRDS